jgi:hypothetical protein
LLVARSVAEAHLYLDIRGCSRADRKSRLVARGDDLVTVYECTCGGEPHQFEFSIPQPEARTGRYGDEAPSTLLGPGELLAWSDRVAQTVPAQPDGLSAEQRDEARRRLEIAAECVLEVLKFVPAGAERVPEEAFRSEADRAMLSLEPGRFSRARLEAIAGAYRQLAQRLPK